MKKIITSRIFITCTSSAIILALVAVIGITIRNSDAKSEIKTSNTTTSSSTTSTSTTTTTTRPPTLTQPTPIELPLLGEGVTLGSGSKDPKIIQYEQRLTDLKFDPGSIDDVFDQKTFFAVQGLQKLKGLPVTGRISDVEVSALNTFQYDQPYAYPAEANHLEVNLDKQVAILLIDYQVRLITPISSGNQKSYSYVSQKTGRYVSSVANTPTGKFSFYRRHKGWEKSDLGHLYNPVYFKGGIAVHGYSQVPSYPASHGCVRIPMYVSEYFPDLVNNGDAVYVYGSKDVSFVADRVGAVAPVKTTTTIPEEPTTLPVVTTQPIPATPDPPETTTSTP